MKRMHVKLTFIEPVLGTWPSCPLRPRSGSGTSSRVPWCWQRAGTKNLRQSRARKRAHEPSQSPRGRQLPREGELWRTEEGEEDGGGLHCSGLDRDAGLHCRDEAHGKRTPALVCVVCPDRERDRNGRDAADHRISEMKPDLTAWQK